MRLLPPNLASANSFSCSVGKFAVEFGKECVPVRFVAGITRRGVRVHVGQLEAVTRGEGP